MKKAPEPQTLLSWMLKLRIQQCGVEFPKHLSISIHLLVGIVLTASI